MVKTLAEMNEIGRAGLMNFNARFYRQQYSNVRDNQA